MRRRGLLRKGAARVKIGAAPEGANFRPESCLTPPGGFAIPANASGDVLQGAAADCNSAGETHAWFDSRVAHHPHFRAW